MNAAPAILKMSSPLRAPLGIPVLLVLLASNAALRVSAAAQDRDEKTKSALQAVNAETDPERRAQHALSLGEGAFADAREAYQKGQVKAGDAALDEMTRLLNACLAALDAGHKSRNYKQAEIRVAGLMRRLKTLIDDLAVDDRGWAEYTARQLEDIHDKLLIGAMKK